MEELTAEQLAEMRQRAIAWTLTARGYKVSRQEAINEQHVALDVIDLLDEVNRLKIERDEAVGWRDTAQGAARILQNDVWYANEKLKTIEAMTRVNTAESIARWLEQRADRACDVRGEPFAAGTMDGIAADIRGGKWRRT